MRIKIKELFHGIKILNYILLFILVYLTLAARIYENEFQAGINVPFLVFMLILDGVVSVFLTAFLLKYLGRLEIKNRHQNPIWKHFLLFTLIPFGILMLCFAAWRPGIYESDAWWQIEQARSGWYNDWHPVLQTWFTYRLPLLLFHGSVDSIVFMQCVELSLVIGYVSFVIMKYTGFRYALLSELFLVLNPIVCEYAMHPLKDITFAMTVALTLTFCLEIWKTEGKWLKNIFHLLILCFVVAASSIVRHNGILFTGPVVLGVIVLSDWKTTLKVLGSVFVFYVLLIHGPAYKHLMLPRGQERAADLMGVPLTIISAAVYKNPEALDQDILDLAYRWTGPETYQSQYEYGNFNNIKWMTSEWNDIIHNKDIPTVLNMMHRCFKEVPDASWYALCRALDTGLSIDGDIYYQDIFVSNTMNNNGTSDVFYTGNENLYHILKDHIYDYAGKSIFRYLFLYMGIYHLLIYALICAKTDFRSRRSRGRFWITGSIVSCTIFTCFLLTGFEFRYLYYIYYAVPIAVVMLAEKNDVVSAKNEIGEYK